MFIMLGFVSCQKVLTVESAIASLDIARKNSGLVVLLMSSQVLGTGVSLPTVAVVYWLAFIGLAHPAGFCQIGARWRCGQWHRVALTGRGSSLW